MNETILITGASGFIGHHLVQAALLKGYVVHAAVRRTSNVDSLNELSLQAGFPIEFVYPDFSKKEALIPVLEAGKYAYIIHAAGATRAKNKDAYNRVNAEYTLHLAQAAISADIPLKRFVFMSSLAALGPVDYNHKPITEASLSGLLLFLDLVKRIYLFCLKH
jgi:nucleoside-diphosphate-sugar epimerase